MFSFFRSTAPKTTDNGYFSLIVQEHQARSADLKPPHASVVLHKLMETYYNNAISSSYYGIPVSLRGWRHHHTTHAADCMTRLKKQDETSVKSAIYYLNDINNIESEGDFAKLLSTFFSFYPEYLLACNANITAALTINDFWAEHHVEAVQATRILYQQHPPREYERYAQLVDVLPKSMADDYADELLQALSNKSGVTQTELYQGWIYLALAKLADKVTPDKREQIAAFLVTCMDNNKGLNISLIGLCNAINLYCHGRPAYDAAANSLYLYIVKTDHPHDMLESELNMFINDSPNTHQLYHSQLFSVLRAYELDYTEIQKQSVMHFLIDKKNIFNFRYALDELHKWLSSSQLIELEKLLLDIKDRDQLIPLFWPWLNNIDYRRGMGHAPLSLPLLVAYSDCRSLAQSELTSDTYCHTVPLAVHMQVFLNQESLTVPSQLFRSLELNLQKTLNAKDDDSREENLESIYEAMPALAEALKFNHHISHKFARLMLNSARMADTVEISGIYAALNLENNFTPAEHAYIRYTLLQAIQTSTIYPSPANTTLQLYLSRIPRQELPPIMTSLLAMDNFSAMMALRKAHNLYILTRPSVQHEQVKIRLTQ